MSERFVASVPSPEKAVSHRAAEEIKGDLAALQLERNAVSDVLEPLLDKAYTYPESERKFIQKFIAKVSAPELTAADFVVPEDCPESLRPLIQELLPCFEKEYALTVREGELQKEYLPQLAAELQPQIEDLSKRIDYDAVFAYFKRAHEDVEHGSKLIFSNEVNKFFALRSYAHRINSPSENPEADYYNLLGATENMRDWGVEWESHGFLKERTSIDAGTTENINTPGTPEARKVLTESLQSSMDELVRYEKFSRIYRTFDQATQERPNRWLAQLDYNVSGSGTDFGFIKEFEKLDFDPKFVAAAIRHTEVILTEYRTLGRLSKTDDDLKNMRASIEAIPFQELVATIPIQGFEAPPGTKLLMDPDELRGWLEYLPPEFCESLLSISHRPPRPKSPDKPNIETAGTFSPVYGSGENWDTVVAKKIEIYLPVAVAESATEQQSNIAKMELLETIWHEFGHNAHHMLDLEEMTVWEEVILDDQTAPTWYVKSSREKNEATGKREDFAESFMMYLSDPALLYKLSALRYQFMSEFFDRRLQESQKQKFDNRRDNLIQAALMFWKEKGMSDDDIRKAYAPHEHA